MRCWTKDDSIADDHAFLAEGKVTLTDVGFMFADVPDVSAVAFASGLRVARSETPAGAGVVEDAAFKRAVVSWNVPGSDRLSNLAIVFNAMRLPLYVAIQQEDANMEVIPEQTACFRTWGVKHRRLPASLESVRRTAIAE